MNRNQRRLAKRQAGPATPAPSPAVRSLFEEAARHHRAGRLGEAEQGYRRVLALEPRHADSLHGLGAIAHHLGRHDAAIELIGAAIAIVGRVAAYHSSLGNALKAQARLDDAAASYRRALQLQPHDAVAHNNLGNVLKAQGQFDAAVASYARAVVLRPGIAELHNNLGNALLARGKPEAAAASYQQALALKPDYAEAHYNLANVLKDIGRHREAVAHYQRALALRPDFFEAHFNLGKTFRTQDRLDEAVDCYERARALNPDAIDVLTSLGAALMAQGKQEAAAVPYERLLALKPDNARFRSDYLMCLNYTDRAAADIFAEHRLFGEIHERDLPPSAPHSNDRDRERRLRIGYVSGDFWNHSVAWFFAPLLAAHDAAAVEVFCYAQVAKPDTVTERLKGQADHWLPTVGMSDESLAARIRADRIDILVDLAGHTANNRLTMFALKPAPVQATWLGYPNTTGLAAMDYRLVDAVTDP
ncbi:MAG: tetratricopeptide repeat protein, partial [Caulobacterales bacterium]